MMSTGSLGHFGTGGRGERDSTTKKTQPCNDRRVFNHAPVFDAEPGHVHRLQFIGMLFPFEMENLYSNLSKELC